MASADASSSSADTGKKSAPSTRVFKKSCPNGKVTTYLGRRDFFDDGAKVDVIDGVVLVDPDYVGRSSDRKVFAQLLAAFRYGREELDVLGLTFRKDLFVEYKQVYPPTNEDKMDLTKLQERLLKKLGENAYPFQFQLKSGYASSVTLQPAPGDSGRPCGVDYQLSTYVATRKDEKVEKRNSVRLAIKKLSTLKENSSKQPYVDLRKEYMFSSYPICVEASLDRELYSHGQEITVHINIDNRSSKTVKGVKIDIKQYADIRLCSSSQYKCVVATLESEMGFPVNPSSHMSQSFTLRPVLEDNREKRGLALDGQLKHEDTNLASSTPAHPGLTQDERDNLGIIVEYKLKATLIVVRGSDMKFELPFRLSHDRPSDKPLETVHSKQPPSATAVETAPRNEVAQNGTSAPAPVPALQPPERSADAAGNLYTPMPTAAPEAPAPVNLISFADETPAQVPDGAAHTQATTRNVNEYVDDDIFFEEFVRLRMEGETDA